MWLGGGSFCSSISTSMVSSCRKPAHRSLPTMDPMPITGAQETHNASFVIRLSQDNMSVSSHDRGALTSVTLAATSAPLPEGVWARSKHASPVLSWAGEQEGHLE